jgi:hypothetical protein
VEARRVEEVSPETFQLSLRIRHPSLDPEEITRALGVEPAHSFRAGAPRSSGKPASAHTQSYWLGALPPIASSAALALPEDRWSEVAQKQLTAATKNLGWALAFNAGRFCKLHAEILRRIRAEGGEVTLLVTTFGAEASSFTLAPEASQLFGELGIALEFDLAS